MTSSKKIVFSSAALAVVLAAGVTVAQAATSPSGGPTTAQYFTGQASPWTINTVNAWGDVPGIAVTTVTVPAGQRGMVDARFTAETLCVGAPSGWCSARIVISSPTLPMTELQPVTGTDFTFDSPGGAAQGHAFERFSAPLGPGTYTVRAQALRTTGITQYTLDDYTLSVGLVSLPSA